MTATAAIDTPVKPPQQDRDDDGGNNRNLLVICHANFVSGGRRYDLASKELQPQKYQFLHEQTLQPDFAYCCASADHQAKNGTYKVVIIEENLPSNFGELLTPQGNETHLTQQFQKAGSTIIVIGRPDEERLRPTDADYFIHPDDLAEELPKLINHIFTGSPYQPKQLTDPINYPDETIVAADACHVYLALASKVVSEQEVGIDTAAAFKLAWRSALRDENMDLLCRIFKLSKSHEENLFLTRLITSADLSTALTLTAKSQSLQAAILTSRLLGFGYSKYYGFYGPQPEKPGDWRRAKGCDTWANQLGKFLYLALSEGQMSVANVFARQIENSNYTRYQNQAIFSAKQCFNPLLALAAEQQDIKALKLVLRATQVPENGPHTPTLEAAMKLAMQHDDYDCLADVVNLSKPTKQLQGSGAAHILKKLFTLACQSTLQGPPRQLHYGEQETHVFKTLKLIEDIIASRKAQNIPDPIYIDDGDAQSIFKWLFEQPCDHPAHRVEMGLKILAASSPKALEALERLATNLLMEQEQRPVDWIASLESLNGMKAPLDKKYFQNGALAKAFAFTAEYNPYASNVLLRFVANNPDLSTTLTPEIFKDLLIGFAQDPRSGQAPETIVKKIADHHSDLKTAFHEHMDDIFMAALNINNQHTFSIANLAQELDLEQPCIDMFLNRLGDIAHHPRQLDIFAARFGHIPTVAARLLEHKESAKLDPEMAKRFQDAASRLMQ